MRSAASTARHVSPPRDPEELPQGAVSHAVVVRRENYPHVWVYPPRGRGGPHREDRVCAVDVHRVGVVEELPEEVSQLASFLGYVVGAAGRPGGPPDYIYIIDFLFAGLLSPWVACYHGCFMPRYG